MSRSVHHIAFYPSDWLAGTRGLTAVETGVYITIVAMMYERGEPITIERKRLARLCGTTPKALEKALETLSDEGKVEEVGGGLWNERVDTELKKARQKSDSARESIRSRSEKDEQNQPPPGTDGKRTKNGRNTNQIQNQSNTTDTRASAHDPGQSDRASELTHRERLLAAMGADPVSGLTGHGGQRLGRVTDMAEVEKWREAGASDADQLAIVQEQMAKRPNGWKPGSFAYFTGAISDHLAAKSKPMPEGQARPTNNRKGPQDEAAARRARWKKIAGGAA